MEIRTIEELLDSKNQKVDYKELHTFFNQKLKELYKEDQQTPLLDYDDIRYSSKIDLIYDLMPSLRDEIKLKKP